jgi:hypothetical protein
MSGYGITMEGEVREPEEGYGEGIASDKGYQ